MVAHFGGRGKDREEEVGSADTEPPVPTMILTPSQDIADMKRVYHYDFALRFACASEYSCQNCEA